MNKTEWEFNHAACPKCGSTDYKQSLVGVPEIDGQFEDLINTAECGCGWKGQVSELVPANTGQTAPMPVKMLDYNGESYCCIKDVAVMLLDFNKKLNNTLPREDMQKFADAIFAEITKSLVTLDMQHWTNKAVFQKTAEEEAIKLAQEQLDGKAPIQPSEAPNTHGVSLGEDPSGEQGPEGEPGIESEPTEE